jgi:hypothetical protein
MQIWLREASPDQRDETKDLEETAPRIFVTFFSGKSTWQDTRAEIVPMLRNVQPTQGVQLRTEAPTCEPAACINVSASGRRIKSKAVSCPPVPPPLQPPGALCMSVKAH